MTSEEDKEFDETQKKLKTLGLKKALREQGIDTKKVPMYKLDEIRRALDKAQIVQTNYDPKFKMLQDEYQKSMNQLNTEMQEEASKAREEVDKLIAQIKTDQGVKQKQPELHVIPDQKQETKDEDKIVT